MGIQCSQVHHAGAEDKNMMLLLTLIGRALEYQRNNDNFLFRCDKVYHSDLIIKRYLQVKYLKPRLIRLN